MQGLMKVSRRKLMSSVGGSALLGSLCYPVLAAPSPIQRRTSFASEQGTEARFLVRDFLSDRLELVRLLKEVTEVEHSLMLQYLYAGFSLKSEFASLAGDGRSESQSFIGVAVQEMQHLGSINKLLVALGASPSLELQDFPFEVDIYPFPMQLEPLSRHSVAKYAYCEAGAHSVEPSSAGDKLFAREIQAQLKGDARINHVGSVYAILIELLDKLRKQDPGLKLDFDYWLVELKRIMDEGEVGHFEFFKSVFMGTHPVFEKSPEWWTHDGHSPHFPAYSVMANPTAYSGHPHQIEDPVSRQLAWLSNLHYWSVLVLLDLYYRTMDESLKYLAISYMLSPLRALGPELARRGYGIPFDRLSLGYSPSRNLTDNLGFAIQLQAEAIEIRRKVESHLPSAYPDAIEQGCIQQLHIIAANWQLKGPVMISAASVFMG